MDDAATWLGAAGGGGLLAVAYLAGLAWTVRRVRGARHPLALIVASALVRGALVVAGLLLLMRGDGGRLLAAFGGFLVVRALVLWRVRAVRSGRATSVGA